MQNYFKINPIFSDKMVLQRDTELVIFGEAKSKDLIEIEFCNQLKSSICKDEKWEVRLEPIAAGGPFEMKLRCYDFNKSVCEEIILTDILLGDVFFASGQSNMQFMLKESLDGLEEIEESYNPNIRYFDVPRIGYEDEYEKIPQIEAGKWVECNKDNSGEFSAIAYYFAKYIDEYIDVPIGIVGCNLGGTSASCWMSEEFLSKNKDIKEYYLDDYYKEINNLSFEEQNKRDKEYLVRLEEHNLKVEEYKSNNPDATAEEVKFKVGNTPWPPPISRKSSLRPSGIYKTMLKKVDKYKVKAVIWYQGEEDTKKSELYEELLKLLIENWRDDRGETQLPFVIIQLPSYEDDKGIDAWAKVREAQYNVSKNLNDVELVVSVDCGERYNIHPIEKRTIAKRLALVVLEKFYKQEVQSGAPEVENIYIEADRAIINFSNLYECNVKVLNEQLVQLFEVSQDGVVFEKAKAVVLGDKIQLHYDNMSKVKNIRYAWDNYVEVGIYNCKGIPLSTFKVTLE